MKNIKRFLVVFISLILVAISSGCWNYREVSDLGIVAGFAVDKNDQTGKYILTLETISSKASEKEPSFSPKVITSEGLTIFDAVRNSILKSGKRLYWSHAKVMIVSSSIAKEGIIPVLDFIKRDAETREETLLVISNEKTAGEIMYGKPAEKQIVSLYLHDVLNNDKSSSKYNSKQMWEFIKEISDKGISATAPAVSLISYNGSKLPQINGTVVFKKDKMVGWLDLEETRDFLWVKNKVKMGAMAMQKVGSKGDDVTLEILNSKTKIKPKFTNKILTMEIDMKTEMLIGEIAGTENLTDNKSVKMLKKAASAKIEKDISSIVKKVQESYGSDIFGFGTIVQRDMPSFWKSIENNWENVFKDIETDINIDIKIRGSALTTKPITPGD